MEGNRNNYRGEWGGLWNRIARYVTGLGYTRNKGTITGILMNGVSKGNVGDIDLGNVQEKIDANHKLSADLIEDGETNKVINVNGSISSANMQDGLKCISAKIWDGTTLVRDYIPVRKNGVGYLWDNVTEELYGNARDTGAFTYGNDVS